MTYCPLYRHHDGRSPDSSEGAGRMVVTAGMDLAPMAAPVVDDEGNVGIEEASHIAVDQSKGADLMPTTTSTVELNTALDKARMEEYDQGRDVKHVVYGIVIGSVLTLLAGGAFIGLNAVV